MTVRLVLVIKHGALGDIVLATAGFSAVRANFSHARITCLTTRAYADMLTQSPYFDQVWTDDKPRFTDIRGLVGLQRMLKREQFDWVIDLQTSTRSTAYQWLLPRPWPNISNISRFASHGYTDPKRHTIHALETIREQLAIAGIAPVGMPDLSWLSGEPIAALPGRYGLLVPGGAAHRPEKRWPADAYATLTAQWVGQGITPVLIGTQAEAEALASIARAVPQAINLGGQTSFGQLADLARGAALAVGNDTGPMHIIAACNCPSLVLFSAASNPDMSRPVGNRVSILREGDLRNLDAETVEKAALRLLSGSDIRIQQS